MVLTRQVVLSEVPFPAGAAAGEHHGPDEIPPAEPHRVPFPSPFPRQEQEDEAAQNQHRALHAANVVLLTQARRDGVGNSAGIFPFLYRRSVHSTELQLTLRVAVFAKNK